MTDSIFETPKELGTLASGQTVIDRPNTHLDEITSEIISEVLSNISAKESEDLVEETVDLGRELAPSKVVETTENDQPNIYYAFRKGRFGYSRFVSGKEPEMGSNVTAVLKHDKYHENTYVLITAYIGKKAGLEPHDPMATAKDIEYWKIHAFVSEVTEIINGSETKEVPEYFK